MKPRIQPTHAACFAVAALLASQPTLAQPTPAHKVRTDEHRVIVDVDSDTTPRVWRIGNRGGYLGVELVELTPELRRHFGASGEAGVMIGSVAPESPAAAAGLTVGDIVLSIDGVAAESRQTVARAIAQASAEETVSIEVLREGSRRTLRATLEERERPQLVLSHSGDSYAFHWRSDDTVLPEPLPAPGRPLVGTLPPIESEQIEEIMGKLHERLDSPEFRARMLEVRSKNQELEERIRQLEARLKELSEKLEELQN
ncbi:MAG: PDZ domain-containing protein [Thermoanaerobaculia bacterium]|nr:PDZ domain-containing protein [Thermoanaerobaculia bacterium]